MRKIIIAVFILFTLTIVGCSHYSDGSRVGEIVKFSKKGYVFKTWEGELLTGAVRGSSIQFEKAKSTSVSNSFLFSVDDKSIADTISHAMDAGHLVRLYYHEERFTFTMFRGNTNYFIDSVKIIQQ